jgi:hypothetical protein
MGPPSSPVAIIDTSCPIKVKELFPAIADQHRVFKVLEERVRHGLLTYPSQVVDELERFAEGDFPALWAKSCQRHLKFGDPPEDYVKRVLKEASDLYRGRVRTVVDPNKTHEDADPYVVAEALYLKDQGRNVAVITNDRFDTPSRIAITTACKMLKLPFQTAQDFLRTLGFPV